MALRVGLPLAVFVAVVAVALFFWWQSVSSQAIRQRADARIAAEEFHARMEAWLEERVTVLEHLARRLAVSSHLDKTYNEACDVILSNHRGFQAINWIDAEGTIRRIRPEKGNERALGWNLYRHPDARVAGALGRAAESGEPAFTPVIELLQGGRGVAGYFPVIGQGRRLEGFVNGVFRVDDIIGRLLDRSALREAYRVDLREPGGAPVLAGEAEIDPAEALVVLPVKVLDGQWRLAIAPLAGEGRWGGSLTGIGLLIVALLLAAGGAWMLSRLIEQNLALRERQRLGQALLAWTRRLQDVRGYEELVECLRDSLASHFDCRWMELLVRDGEEGCLRRVGPEVDSTAPVDLQLVERVCSERRPWFGRLPPGDGQAGNAAVIPLMVIDRCIGVLAFGGETERAPSEAEREYLADVAGHLGVVISRIQYESERGRLQAQVLQSQKFESLGVLAGGIAHDFNNMLVTVLGNADLVLAELGTPSPEREYVEDIATAAQRASELCRQMLVYSGKGHFRVEAVDLPALVREMAHLLEVALPKGTVLSFDFDADLPLVLVDPAQMRQVVMNLITNAAEAIDGGTGSIRLALGVQHCSRSYLDRLILGPERDEGAYVFLEVADTGTGMSREVAARLFDPFFSTKKTGRGLGMAVVIGIIRGHGGALCVCTEKGKGTTVKVLLPAAAEGVEAVEAGTAREGAWSGSGTVLLVDDEPSVRRVAARMLEKAGLEVIEAEDGRQAIERFRARAETIDVVLLDLTMPQMDGEQAFREIRRMKEDVPVIFSSGHGPRHFEATLADESRVCFLRKPYLNQALVDALQQLL